MSEQDSTEPRHETNIAQESDAENSAINESVSMPRYFGFGLCMGCADAVPGVSGGTIALILGYYDAFISALAQVLGLIRRPFSKHAWIDAVPSFKLLVPLAIGAITALYVATKLLVGKSTKIGDLSHKTAAEVQAIVAANPPQGLLLNPTSAPYIFALFFGLVLISIPQPWNNIKQHRYAVDLILAVLAAGIVAVISLANPASLGTHPALIIASGALAISVMLLPGISGSLVLLVIGMYQPISQAVHNKEISILAYFFLGVVIGLASFVPLLKWILAHYHDRTMAILSGLMAGSLLALWPWKTHYTPKLIEYLGPMYPSVTK